MLHVLLSLQSKKKSEGVDERHVKILEMFNLINSDND